MFKNTASQKLTVLAFADAGHATLDAGDRVTGDAANITCKVEQDDDGTQSATNDVNPAEVEDGQYRFDLLQAETNGDKLTFYPESSTAGVQVVALPSNVIYTRPPNFTAMGIETDGDLTKVNTLDGHTAQTGDSFARLGAPAGADIAADVAAVKAETALIVADTNELQTDWADGGRLDLLIDQIAGDLPNRITKNTALANFQFLMVDTNDNPKTGLTITAQRSIDGAAFGACANSASELSNGAYVINLDAADLNGDTIMLRFTATGAKDRLITIVTQAT